MTRESQSQVRAFREVLREFERQQRCQLEERDSCCGLTLAQCHPLLEIHELGNTTTGDLARRLNLDKSTLSRAIDGLVSLGMVQRGTHESDRRIVPLELTAEGHRRCEEINEKNDRLYRRILRKIPESEREEMIRLFKVLVRAMADEGTV